MINTAAGVLTPNQMMANGTQARPGIGRRTRTIHAGDDAECDPEPGAHAQARQVMTEAAGNRLQPSTAGDLLQKGRRDRAGAGEHRRIDEAQTRHGLPQPKKDEEAEARKQEKAHKGSVALGGVLVKARLKEAFERQLLVERAKLDLVGLHEARRLDDRARIDLELGRR